MPHIVLNLTENEYIICDSIEEQQHIIRKLLSHKEPTSSLDWKVTGIITYYKSVIRWEKNHKIILVPSNIEQFVLKNKHYNHISLIASTRGDEEIIENKINTTLQSFKDEEDDELLNENNYLNFQTISKKTFQNTQELFKFCKSL
jgi:DNA polymerase III alpha subunit (gram-positive type)